MCNSYAIYITDRKILNYFISNLLQLYNAIVKETGSYFKNIQIIHNINFFLM